MKKLLLLILILLMINTISAQTLLTESFDADWPGSSGWTVISNGPAAGWVQHPYSWNAYLGAGCASYYSNCTEAADSWALTPDIALIAGNTYAIEFYQKVSQWWNPEKMKVTVGQGQSVAAQMTTLWENDGGPYLTNDTYLKRTALFTCPVTGNYNIGFVEYSDPCTSGLYLDEVRIYLPVTADAAPINFTASEVTVNSMKTGWTDNSTNETAFRVYRSTDDVTYTQVGNDIPSTSSAGTGNNYSLAQTGLSTGTNYYYRITAVVDLESDWLAGDEVTLVPSLSGLKTVGPVISNDYPSITAAIADMVVHGLSGPLMLELQSGYSGAGDEPSFPIVIPVLPEADSIKTVMIYPAVPGLLIDGSAGNGTFRFDGGSFVTIDGRPAGNKSTGDLEIRNSSTSATDMMFINGACHNTVKYCQLKGVNAGDSGIVCFSTTTGTSGNDDNSVDHCDIGGDGINFPVFGICSFGSDNTGNNRITISDNNIFDFRGPNSAGIYFLGNITDWSSRSSGWVITGNSFFQQTGYQGFEGTTAYGINIQSSQNEYSFYNEFTITGNYIGGSAPQCGGTAWSINGTPADFRFAGIRLNTGVYSPSSLQGNTIANFNWLTTSNASSLPGIWCGIYIPYGWLRIGDEVGNQIGSATGTGSVTITSSVAGGASYGVGCAGGTFPIIMNNTIGSITISGSTNDVSHSFYGIYLNGAPGNPINNNLVGSLTTPNSINCVTPSTSSIAQSLYGIYNEVTNFAYTYQDSIKYNTVANLNNNCAASPETSGQVVGIFSKVDGVIGWNVIRDLTTSSPNEGVNETASLIGIASVADRYQMISGNRISQLHNTCSDATAVTIYGIYHLGADFSSWPPSQPDLIDGNLVHSLKAGSGHNGSVIWGIFGSAGPGGMAWFKNNMVRLGSDTAGNSITDGYDFRGIVEKDISTATNHFQFNSVYIGGSGVDVTSSATYAFCSEKLPSGKLRDYRNNILVNARKASSGPQVHYACWLPSADTAWLRSDYNIYHQGNTGNLLFRVGLNEISGLQNYRATLAGQELHSGAADPGFINPGGSAATGNLHLSGTSPAESAGDPVAEVVSDYDSQDRSALTPADIGADAGNFTSVDAFTPTISFKPLPMTATLVNRQLNNVAIADVGTGVPVSGTNVPRIWFRRSAPTISAWASTAGTLVTGTGNSGSWNFIIDYSLLDAGPSVGDTFQYYVVAQDMAVPSNIWYTPFDQALHTGVNSQDAPPSDVYSYPIVIPISGNYDAGPGLGYTSLTADAPDGVFKKINASLVTGNITVTIKGDLIEPGTVALNRLLVEPEGSGFTVTIIPENTTERLISGDAPGGLIRLNGTDRFIIDGRFESAGKYLRFRNVSTEAPVITLINDASWNTIRDCYIEGACSVIDKGLFLFSTSTGPEGNHDNTITGCIFRDRSDGTGFPANHVYSKGTKGYDNHSNTIHGNEFMNFTNIGIGIEDCGDDWSITGNSLYCQAPDLPSPGVFGIQFLPGISAFGNLQPTRGHTISGNFIGGTEPQCGGAPWNVQQYLYAISVTRWDSISLMIQGNTIQNLHFSNTGQVVFSGIQVQIGSNLSIQGNTIGHATMPASISLPGSAASAEGIRTNYGTQVVTDNVVANFDFYDTPVTYNSGWLQLITLTPSGPVVVNNNSVHDINYLNSNYYYTTVRGLGVYNGTTLHAENNSVYNLTSANTASPNSHSLDGMDLWGFNSGTITRNRVYHLVNNNPGTQVYCQGMYIQNLEGTANVVNNIVSLGEDIGNSVRITGIIAAGYGTGNYYYNSVSITGTGTGALSSMAFDRKSPTETVVKNNIFHNSRTGGTSRQYAIANEYNYGQFVSDYNDLFTVNGPLGYFAGAFPQTLSDWRTASDQDQHSHAFDPAFTSISGLSPASGNNTGTPLPDFTADINGSIRDNATPDVGAYEHTGCISPMTWTGATSSEWNDRTNWNPSTTLPNPNTAVIIPATTIDPVIPVWAECLHLDIEPSGALAINPGGTTVVNGNLTIDESSTLESNGKVEVKGNLAQLSSSSWMCGKPFTDTRDSKVYRTLLIGSQCWMKENLNIGTLVSGTVNQGNNGTIEKYCYDDLESNCDIYGGFYQWGEAMAYAAESNTNPSGRKGICPDGWHMPSDVEWCQLNSYLDTTYNCSAWSWNGNDAGGKMKEPGSTHWDLPNTGATNLSGFTGLPAGLRYEGSPTFLAMSNGAYFWSTTIYIPGIIWIENLNNVMAQAGHGGGNISAGLSIRCLRDN